MIVLLFLTKNLSLQLWEDYIIITHLTNSKGKFVGFKISSMNKMYKFWSKGQHNVLLVHHDLIRRTNKGFVKGLMH